MSWPSIDHSLLSPSGKTSRRARKAAQERVRQELFGDGLPFPACEQPTKKEQLLQNAKMWRGLADRGMSPRKHGKAAEKAELEASKL